MSTEIKWIKRAMVQNGIELPYRKHERYGRPGVPVHTVLEEGVVFIPESVLRTVAERTPDDYLVGRPAPEVEERQGIAMSQARLAVREVRGGWRGTDKLRNFLRRSSPDTQEALSER